MSASSGMSQLLKGIVIGMVLILAVVGSMSLLKTKDNSTSDTQSVPTTNIQAPEISINSTENNKSSVTATTTNDKENTTSKTEAIEATQTEAMKPVLESEKEAEEIEKQQVEEISYGMLTVSAINPDNQDKLTASYAIYDKNEKKIAETLTTQNTSYRLATGQYKVVTILKQDENVARNSPPVQQSKLVTISADTTTNQVFQLTPPPTTGVLQVSAFSAKGKQQAIRANFIVQDENGKTVATRNNVSNSLFKLKAGSYKVTVRSGNNSDYKTIVVDPGESTQEVFKLQEAFKQGSLLVRIFDTRSSNPVSADIIVSNAAGETIQELKAVTKTEISLAAGNYRISVTGPNGQSSKKIRIAAGQPTSEIFRFDAPQTNNSSEGTQITDNVTIRGVDDQKSNQTRENPTDTDQNNNLAKGNLRLFAKNAANQKPLKSNFYVQTPAGKHLDKKIYADSAEFSLPPGIYKITVRSKNRKNSVRNIQVIANQSVSQTFSLARPDVSRSPTTSSTVPTLAPPKPAKNNSAVPNGFLSVSMLPGSNKRASQRELNTHFIVTANTGKKIVELTSVPSANFKLDTGIYKITAIHNNKRKTRSVIISKNQTARVSFNLDDFQAKPKLTRKGRLRSRIINPSGQPLKANLTVTNLRGQIIARANGVSVGVFDLPPVPHTINVDYKGLRGSERINIRAGETTVQTFTIAPDRAPPPNNTPGRNKSRDFKDLLKEKIKEEIRKQF